MENLPGYVSITFILTTFLTVGFLIYAIRQKIFDTLPSKILTALIAFWLIFQATLALGGFYQRMDVVPPRVFAFGVLPAIVLIALFFILFRKNFIERLPLKTLTLLHVIRIPVEIVLLWLFQNGLVPEAMTFEGRNFDILSGITAPIVYWAAFRAGRTNRALLTAWNIFTLLLLLNIVTNAVMALPSPMQQIAFDQPNIAVTYFPFVWLPSIVVPIVLFSHIASLWKLYKGQTG
ncbi:MAG: hypothetical protein H0V90_04835 [Blastocatellia bacterium]|nr:hypothetical protein [Blastocatellia bacterium]